jgi:hypothetical protein
LGKNFTNPTSDRGLASKKYKKLKKLTSTKPNNPIKKLVLELIPQQRNFEWPRYT